MKKYLFEWPQEMSWHLELPDASLDIDQGHYTAFFRTMYERQNIWYNRFVLDNVQGPGDSILTAHRFRNVYPEHDASTQYLIQYIIRLFADTKGAWALPKLLWKMIIFRLMPDVESYETCGRGSWAPNLNARNIKANIKPIKYITAPGVDLEEIWVAVGEIASSMAYADSPYRIVSILASLKGIGSHLAYELYKDFCYIPVYSDLSFKFYATKYAQISKGSSLGLRLIYPKYKPNQQESGIWDLLDAAKPQLEMSYPAFRYVEWDGKANRYVPTTFNLTAFHIERWLAEYAAYWKLKIGLGRQRPRFIPSTLHTIYHNQKLL